MTVRQGTAIDQFVTVMRVFPATLQTEFQASRRDAVDINYRPLEVGNFTADIVKVVAMA